MTQSNVSAPESGMEAKLPRRDWILLPLLSLATIGILAGSTELISRRVFSELRTLNRCLMLDDSTVGVRGIPNSVCWEKAQESELIEYRFDGCGYRSNTACGPKAPGRYRIVMIGSSFAMGTMVPIDRTFTALLPAELSQKSANKVEVYSEGLADGFTRSVDLRFKDVLAANPDLVLWVMTPVDVQLAAVSSVKAQEAHPDIAESNRRSQEWASAKGWMKEVISRHTGAIESGFMLRHFLYEHESQSQYIHLYLMRTGGDEPHPVGIDGDANFLRAELSPEWRAHLKEFNGYTAEICNKAKNAGVPIIGVLVPNRAQAAMISMGEWPPGYDPYKLDNELRAIITSHGGTYIDILPYFHKIPNPEKGYFPVDGHLNAKGYAMIADMLSYEFTSGAIPALKAAKQPLSKLAQER